MNTVITISVTELDALEEHYQKGVQMCHRIRKKLDRVSTQSSARQGKGLSEADKNMLKNKRHNNIKSNG